MAKFELSYLKEMLQVLQSASVLMDTRYRHIMKVADSMDQDPTFIAVIGLTGGLASTLRCLDGVIIGLKSVIEMEEEDIKNVRRN